MRYAFRAGGLAWQVAPACQAPGGRWRFPAVRDARCGVRLRRGVLNIVHGTRGTVNAILDHPDIKAVSFVGSDAAGRYIYERGSASGKRVQVRAASKPISLRPRCSLRAHFCGSQATISSREPGDTSLDRQRTGALAGVLHRPTVLLKLWTNTTKR